MNAQVESSPHLRGKWLLLARLAWTAGFIGLAIAYTFSFLAVHDALSTVCEDGYCTLGQQIRHTGAGDQVIRSLGPSLGSPDRLRPDQVEALARLGLTLDQYGWLGALLLGIPALILLLIAAWLFWRKSYDPLVLGASVMVATYPIHNTPLFFTLMVRQPGWEWVYHGSGALALTCLLVFPLVFPNGEFVPRWTRRLALYNTAAAVIAAFLGGAILDGFGDVFGKAIIFGLILLPFGIGVFAQLYRYFRAALPAERQQFKWVVFGLAGVVILQFCIAIPLNALLASRAANSDPAQALLLSAIPRILWQISILLVPVCLAISILRYRLWDVDIFINRTLAYAALSASVLGLYVLIVGWLSLGLQTNTLPANILAILIIALLFQPLRRGLQGIADRFVPVPESAAGMEQHESRLATTQGHTAADTALRGRWLLAARLVWAAVILTLTVMYAFAVLAERQQLSTVCEEEPCTLTQQIRQTGAGEQILNFRGSPIGYADPLRPDQAQALGRLGLTLDQYGWLAALQTGIPVLIYLLIAAVLFWRKSDNWMVLFVSIMVATIPCQNQPLPFILAARQPAWDWIYAPAEAVALSCLMVFPLIFPTGAFAPRWTRWLVLPALACAVTAAWLRYSMDEDSLAGQLLVGYIVFSFVSGIYAQLYRYSRAASPIERQQIKWVVAGLAVFIFTALTALLPLNRLLIARAPGMDPARALVLSASIDTIFQGISLFIPVSIVISILRYHVWDIDLIINRTLVYGALTGIVAGTFVLMVGSVGNLIQSSSKPITAILATGLVALLFNPLRQRLQRGVNRLMYGERDEPYAALSRLGRRLESTLAAEAVLPAVVTTVREVLKLPYVAIYLEQDSKGFQIAAESASPSLRLEEGRVQVPGMNREGLCMPLIHQGETLGYIVLGPRAPTEAFSSTDLRLLNDLAPQVGVAVHAARLTADLQRSREQLVLAREEERRRLRRDLHDGLGPQLAGLALKLETARNRMAGDPQAAAMLTDLSTRTQEAVADIRRLVYGLRPPALDELGLLMALREGVIRHNEQCVNGTIIAFEAPETLPALPAAVEVAAYRIAQEGLNNVLLHAQAHTCILRISMDDGIRLLCLEILDDGKGLPLKRHAGVGLNSMRERAEELGGSLAITSPPAGGTLLTARLPCRLHEIAADAGTPAPVHSRG